MAIIQVSVGESTQLIIQFPYSSERVAAVKRIPGRQWHPQARYWTVPRTADVISQLEMNFTGDRLSVSADIISNQGVLSGTEIKTLLNEVDKVLTLRHASKRTRQEYGRQVRRFLQRVECHPQEVTAAGLKKYLVSILDSGLSVSYYNQARAALLFLHGQVLSQPDKFETIPAARPASTLPIVPTPEEIDRLLRVTRNLKYRTIFTLAYAGGLCLNEVVNLKLTDIDTPQKCL